MASPSGTSEKAGDRPEIFGDAKEERMRKLLHLINDLYINGGVEKMRKFVALISKLHDKTSHCHRVQRGSPAAKSLTRSMESVKSEINSLVDSLLDVVENHHYQGMKNVEGQLKEFNLLLKKKIEEKGSEEEYAARVAYLEELNYCSGTLMGHLEAMITLVEYVSAPPVRQNLFGGKDDNQVDSGEGGSCNEVAVQASSETEQPQQHVDSGEGANFNGVGVQASSEAKQPKQHVDSGEGVSSNGVAVQASSEANEPNQHATQIKLEGLEIRD